MQTLGISEIKPCESDLQCLSCGETLIPVGSGTSQVVVVWHSPLRALICPSGLCYCIKRTSLPSPPVPVTRADPLCVFVAVALIHWAVHRISCIHLPLKLVERTWP